jgi:hypothetical protein
MAPSLMQRWLREAEKGRGLLRSLQPAASETGVVKKQRRGIRKTDSDKAAKMASMSTHHVARTTRYDNENTPRKTTAALPLAIRLIRAGRKEDLRRLIRHGTAGKPLADRVTEIRPSPDEMVRLTAKEAFAPRSGCGPIAPQDLDAPIAGLAAL